MADSTLAPQGVNNPNYNPGAALGAPGSLDPSISVPSPAAGSGTVASSLGALSSAGNSGLSAVSTSVPPIPSKASPADLNKFLGTNGFTDKQLGTYGITQNPDGTYNVPQGAINVRSQQLNQNAIVSSSGSVVQNENGISSTVNGLVNGSKPITLPDGSVQPASDHASQALATLDNYTQNLEARRASEAASINAAYDAKQTQTENKQANETGSTSAAIARTGGYLGGSASGTGVMINLAASHQTELLQLQASRQSALQAAQTAIDDKEFAVAQSKISEINTIDKTISDRQQQFFDNAIKLQQANNANTKDQIDFVDSTLKNLSTTNPSSVPQATKDKIDQFYGTPGFTDNYLKVTNAAAASKSLADSTKAKSDMLDMLTKIPAGQKVSFPDGTTYTGIGAAGDIATFLQTDNNGIGHLITYNKRTNQTTAQTMGPVGKTSSGSANGGVAGVAPTVVDNAKAIIQTNLEASKDPSTGQYNPDTYLNLRTELKAKYPQLLAHMDSIFLNPTNKFFGAAGITKLRQKGVTYTALPTTDPAAAAAAADQTQADNAP